jgi:hypothetical protein
MDFCLGVLDKDTSCDALLCSIYRNCTVNGCLFLIRSIFIFLHFPIIVVVLCVAV